MKQPPLLTYVSTISARLGNDERLLKQSTHGLRRLRTLGDPVLDRRGVKVGLLSDRIVPAELLDRSTVAASARVDGDEAVKRFLLATSAGKTKRNPVLHAQRRAGTAHSLFFLDRHASAAHGRAKAQSRGHRSSFFRLTAPADVDAGARPFRFPIFYLFTFQSGPD